MFHSSPISKALFVVLLAALPTACKSTETHDRAAMTADAVVEVGGTAGQTQLHLDKTLDALQNITAQAAQDPKPPFNSFASALSSFSSSLKSMTKERAEFETMAQEWFNEFAQRNETISDEDLRKDGTARVEEFRERVADINKQVDALLSDSHAFEGRLNDLRTFLGNDLTTGAVNSVSGRIKDATKDGRGIAERLGKLSKSSEEMAAKLRAAREMAPPPAAAK